MHWQGTSVLTKDLVGDRHRLMRCPVIWYSLQWRHNGLDDVSNHQPHHCLLSRLLGRRSKKTSKLRVTGLCAGNSPGTGEFPTQMASKVENASIWWRHHVLLPLNVAVKILHMKQVIIFCIVSFRASCRWFLRRNKLDDFAYCYELFLTDQSNFMHVQSRLNSVFKTPSSRVTHYTAGHLHTAVPHCSHSRAPIVHTAVPPLFTQPCPARTMSTAVCIYVAGLCASCPAVLRVTRDPTTVIKGTNKIYWASVFPMYLIWMCTSWIKNMLT